jgi:PAS domain S-box-containing protein
MSLTQNPHAPHPTGAGWLADRLQSPRGVPELLYALFEGNPDMVVVADSQQRIVAANSRALAGFGYLREELEGQPVSILLPEAARKRHAGHVRSFLAHPSVRSMGSGMDLRARDAGGTEFAVDVMLWPFAAESGQYAVAVCRRPDAALARSQVQMHAMIDSVRDYAINLLDAQGRILTWNEGARRIHGLSATEALGQNFSIFFLPNDVERREPDRLLEEAAQAGHCHTTGWRKGAEGVTIWAEIDFTPIRDVSGQLTGFTRVLHDMTAHKRAEEAQRRLEASLQQIAADLEERVAERTRQLQATVDELRRKNEEVEAFVYIVSHDLRAPLVNVQGFALELEQSCARLKSTLASCPIEEHFRDTIREILDEEIAGALHFISASSSKFERLIDALLGLSRQGRQVYQIVQVDVHELVVDTVASLQQLIAEAGASVQVGSLPPASADMTALGQVFSNLIGNAIKYRSPLRPLQVEVGGAIEDGTRHYWVRDNGLGIPETGKSRLFQVFQRLHPQQAPGEGMGLAIAHRIVERHGGKIWAESREGEGTAFHFCLPLSFRSAAAVPQEAIHDGRA